MLSSIFGVPAVPGACSPRSFRTGKRSIITFGVGVLMEPGSKLITTLHQWSRVIEDREPSPSATILDSQSVKTATPSAVEVGYDAAKRIKGRKRHLLVDSLGLVLMVVVTAASVPERAGAQLVFAQLKWVRH